MARQSGTGEVEGGTATMETTSAHPTPDIDTMLKQAQQESEHARKTLKSALQEVDRQHESLTRELGTTEQMRAQILNELAKFEKRDEVRRPGRPKMSAPKEAAVPRRRGRQPSTTGPTATVDRVLIQLGRWVKKSEILQAAKKVDKKLTGDHVQAALQSLRKRKVVQVKGEARKFQYKHV